MNVDDRIFISEPLARAARLVIDNVPASVDMIQSHSFDVRGKTALPDGWIWRPYLTLWSFRVSGVAGTLRGVTIAFRPQGSTPAGATAALQIAALDNDADQITIFSSTGTRIETFAADDGRGIPFPIDDSGAWDLWIGSLSAAARAVAHFQVGWHPIRVGAC